jgi:hypothetical protein
MHMTSSLLGCCARPFSSTSMSFKLSIPYSFFGLGKSFQARLATNHSMAMMNQKKKVEILHGNSKRSLIVSTVSFDIQCGHPLLFKGFALCWMCRVFWFCKNIGLTIQIVHFDSCCFVKKRIIQMFFLPF